MDSILQKYNLLTEKYQTIEVGSLKFDIQDRGNIIQQIFSLLSALKIDAAKVKNGKKAIQLFEKLRDVQSQLRILENAQLNPELVSYLSVLKEKELQLKWKIQRFTKKKKIEFPEIKKKSKINKSKTLSKISKILEKLDSKVHSSFIDYPENVHKLRTLFLKFLYHVEILSYLDTVDNAKLDKLKLYQNQLGEIHDYEILMKGIARYFMKREWYEDKNIAIFEQEQNALYETFIYNVEGFIGECKAVIKLNH